MSGHLQLLLPQRVARGVLLLKVGLVTGLASAVALFLIAPRAQFSDAFLGQHDVGAERADAVVGLSAADLPSQCEHLPNLQFEELLYSNLGNKGPDSGNGTGYVIQARDLGGGDVERVGRKVMIVINSTNDKYIPAEAKANKMNGRFASISMRKNAELAFKMRLFDSKYEELVMPEFAITFFDLDADINMEIAEGLEIGGFKEKYIADNNYLKVTDLGNGITRFEATQQGVGEDNPKNFQHLSTLQRKRAVTLLFDNVSEITGKLTTGGGRHAGYRRFDFVAQPTVICARREDVPDKDFAKFPPLPEDDLLFRPPMEKPVIDHAYPQYFEEWKKELGDKVREGDVIATVKVDGVIRELKSQANGTVVQTQDLVKGDRVDFKLATMNIAVIAQEVLPALPTGNNTVKAGLCHKSQFLDHYEVSVGQVITRDTVIAVTKNALGKHRQELRAPQGGLISGIQPLKPGQTCQKAEDLNLVTIGKFPPMVPRPGEHGCCQGMLGTTFKEWKRDVGDQVAVGDVIATVQDQGKEVELTCKSRGFITSKLPLIEGMPIDKDVGAIASIGTKLRELDQLFPEISHACPGTFKEWKVDVGDKVEFEQTLVDMDPVPVLASATGIVTKRQEGLKSGMKHGDVAFGKICINLGPSLLEVKPGDGETPIKVLGGIQGKTFNEWIYDVGDSVEKEFTIATIKTSEGDIEDVTATAAGMITQTVAAKPGQNMEEVCDTVSSDTCVLATTGEHFPRLLLKDGGSPIKVPDWPNSNLNFSAFLAEVGEQVESGAPVAAFKTEDGKTVTANAPHAGIVLQRLEALDPRMKMDKVLLTDSIATIGQLPDLLQDPAPGEDIVQAPENNNEMFEQYLVKENDTVSAGDVIAQVSYMENTTKNGVGPVTVAEKVIENITSPESGVVEKLNEDLTPGVGLNEQTEDPQMAVISSPQGPQVGFNQAGCDVPEGAFFKAWLKEVGEYVEKGEGVAAIQVPSSRRLTVSKGRRLSLVDQTVYAPTNGYVSKTSHLVPGQKISDQQIGSTIVVLDLGPPWWIALLCFLLALCCMMGCLFRIMKKPEPPEPEPESVEEELKPLRTRFEPRPKQGCRLDFERPDKYIHSVHAQFRPLGIHHGSVAPLVANDFTINSYAKDALGVEQGYVLVGINGESVRGDSDWDRVSSNLMKHLGQFPQWPLEIEFRETLESQPKIITFVEQPIGLEFQRQTPVQVQRVLTGSPAAAKGISPGWYITKIGNKSVLDETNFHQVMVILKEGIQPLDAAKKVDYYQKKEQQ